MEAYAFTTVAFNKYVEHSKNNETVFAKNA